MKYALAALLLATAIPGAVSAQAFDSDPLQFIGVESGGNPKAWFIERPSGPQGIKDLHDFWAVGINGAKLRNDAEIMEVQLIFPCGAEEYIPWGTMLWRDGKIVGGEDAGIPAPRPIKAGATLAALRDVACGKRVLKGPLLKELAQVKQAAAAAAKPKP